MNDSSISVRYAKALFESASDQKIAEKVLDDLNSIAELIREIKSFKDFIDSPIIQVNDKIRIFKETLKNNCQDLTFRFLELITQNKRESYLPGIIRKYQQLYRTEKGIISATLTVVNQTDKKLIDSIKTLLKKTYNADVELSQKTDSEIIGGFILRVEDEQLDASVVAQLKKIERELSQSVLLN